MISATDRDRSDGGVDLVVVGLGYVGLPLAQQATRCGVSVAGFDISATTVDALNDGKSHIDDLTDDDVRAMLAAGFSATTDPTVIENAAAVVICVPTPLDDSGGPDLAAVRGAASIIAAHLRPGMLVVLESTSYPGTTEDVLRPLLETSGLVAGEDFHVAYSPERIDPGNPTFGVKNTPKVVGGVNERSTKAARELYDRFIDLTVPTVGTREAEMAKLLENTYRHVNIALVNEMAVFCHDLGIDLWDAINAASTKPFGFQPFYPGPGVGGHCIPIDPNYLSYKVRTLGYPFRFVELAQEISSRMPAYVVTRVMLSLNSQRKSLNGATILLLGVTYKRNIADERETPAQPIAQRLCELGAVVEYADPHVHRWVVGDRELPRRDDIVVAAEAADIVVILQDHDAFDLEGIVAVAGSVFDTRGCVNGGNVERL